MDASTTRVGAHQRGAHARGCDLVQGDGVHDVGEMSSRPGRGGESSSHHSLVEEETVMVGVLSVFDWKLFLRRGKLRFVVGGRTSSIETLHTHTKTRIF